MLEYYHLEHKENIDGIKMVFEEALKAIKEGKKVRKKDWPKNKYIYLAKPVKERRIVDNENNFYNLGQCDLFVDEWIEYVEK